MGVLPYPDTKKPVVVVEVRSYPSILGDIKGDIDYDLMKQLMEAEMGYIRTIKDIYGNKQLDFQKAEEDNLNLLNKIVPERIKIELGKKGFLTQWDRMLEFYQ